MMQGRSATEPEYGTHGADGSAAGDARPGAACISTKACGCLNVPADERSEQSLDFRLIAEQGRKSSGVNE